MNIIYYGGIIITITIYSAIISNKIDNLKEITIKHEVCVQHTDFGGRVYEPCEPLVLPH